MRQPARQRTEHLPRHQGKLEVMPRPLVVQMRCLPPRRRVPESATRGCDALGLRARARVCWGTFHCGKFAGHRHVISKRFLSRTSRTVQYLVAYRHVLNRVRLHAYCGFLHGHFNQKPRHKAPCAVPFRVPNSTHWRDGVETFSRT